MSATRDVLTAMEDSMSHTDDNTAYGHTHFSNVANAVALDGYIDSMMNLFDAMVSDADILAMVHLGDETPTPDQMKFVRMTLLCRRMLERVACMNFESATALYDLLEAFLQCRQANRLMSKMRDAVLMHSNNPDGKAN